MEDQVGMKEPDGDVQNSAGLFRVGQADDALRAGARHLYQFFDAEKWI